MGKRSGYPRRTRDLYQTPRKAVAPLLRFLSESRPRAPALTFAEPCAGDGALVGHLESAGLRCLHKSDIEPQRRDIKRRDALNLCGTKVNDCDLIITNPPWRRDRKTGFPLIHMIKYFSSIKPTWLLLDADFMHIVLSAQVMGFCSHIISVGRVKWIENSNNTGKDNAAWYLFESGRVTTHFHPRCAS